MIIQHHHLVVTDGLVLSGCHGLLHKHVEVEMNATKLQA